jgi:hypothetical protein
MDAASEKNSVVQSSSENAEFGQYPHGLKLIILASAALVAVFLIALDQVSSLLSSSQRAFAK